MYSIRLFLLLVLVLSADAVAQGAPTADEEPSLNSDARLISEAASISPGQTFTVGLLLTMEKGWHSYWMNPGDSGTATSIKWRLPAGFHAGEIRWPYPKRLELPPLVTYGYEDEVLLLTDITAPKNIAASHVTLAGTADWLICAHICLPATGEISLTLPVGVSAADSGNGTRFARARAMLPKPAPAAQIIAEQAEGWLQILAKVPAGEIPQWQKAQFFAADPATINHAARPHVETREASVRIVTERSEYAAGPAKRLRGVVVLPQSEARALWIDVPVQQVGIDAISVPPPATVAAINSESTSPPERDLTVALAIALAFAGGLLLNLMPCIFPVLSLKVLHIVQQGGGERSAIRKHGLMFMAGVVALFWVLAGGLLALQAGGAELGWGFQLQSPAFVALIALLLFALGLNLLGVFEIGLALTGAGGFSGGLSGYSASFMSGALVTIVATPCTAPFMGVAMGYALAQPATSALIVFTAIGVGLAAPYVLFTFSPGLMHRLPRPGAWMETFKQLMAFPLFATVIWLLWVFGLQTDMTGAAYLLAGLLLLAMAGWVYGRWATSGRSSGSRRAAWAGTALLAIAALATSVHASRQQTPVPGEKISGAVNDWQPYSSKLLDEYRFAGRPVFVDFTAAWCITCQVNKRVTLNSADVHAEFARRNVALVQADWTRRDAEITRALRSFGRSGVPLYVLYYGDGRAPRVLPEVLIKGALIEALKELPELKGAGSK